MREDTSRWTLEMHLTANLRQPLPAQLDCWVQDRASASILYDFGRPTALGKLILVFMLKRMGLKSKCKNEIFFYQGLELSLSYCLPLTVTCAGQFLLQLNSHLQKSCVKFY